MKFKPKKFSFDKVKKVRFHDDDMRPIRNKRYERDRIKEITRRENKRIKKIKNKWKEIYPLDGRGNQDILEDLIAYGPYTPDLPVDVIKDMLKSPEALRRYFGAREKMIFGTFDNFVDYLRDWVELVEIYENRSARQRGKNDN